MKKMLFVMNPYAGTRKAVKVLSEIITVFNRADYQVSVYMTAGPGDAERAVVKMAAGMDLVVCCGGDGTFNETVSGLLEAGVDVPLGYIPAGSTNDFAASLRLSSDPVQAAKDILAGEEFQYDVGLFGDRYFTYVASFGAFTRASYATPQSVKNALGHTAYVLEGISELTQIKNIHVRLEMDDEVLEDDFLFGAISNSTSVGGILTLDSSMVDLSDGLFEVLLIRAPRGLGELAECIQALRTRNYDNCAMITFRSTSRVKVVTGSDMIWTLDGERADTDGQVDVRNLNLAVRLIKKAEEV